jgi:predicted O-linked N-acetylglucosamine transferase (SPINDLY family)
MNTITPDDLFDQALQIHLRGDLESAAEHYRKLLTKYPNHADTLHHLGLAKLQQGEIKEAINWIRRSIEVNEKQFNALSNLGYCLNFIGDHEEALNVCEKSISLNAENDGAWTNLGNAQRELLLTIKAKESYEKALELQPNNPRYLYNLANAFYDLKIFDKAKNLFEKTITLEPKIAEAHNNLAACLIKLKKFNEALSHAITAIELKPDYAEAWSNRGNTLNDLNRHEEALASYERALQLKPDYAEAWSNRSNALHDLKRHEDALASCQRAIELKPDYAEAWSNRGNTLNDLKRHEEALASYERALQLKPGIDFLLGSLIHTQMKICDWTDLDSKLGKLKTGIEARHKCSNPFPFLGLTDSPKLQQAAAEIYARENYQPSNRLGPIAKCPKKRKIRLGYYSADFYNHAMSYLMAELFESHDRKRFELVGFSFGPDVTDGMRQRVSAAFDNFIDVSRNSDLDVAKLSRDLGVDIAVDLNGYTKDSRTQIFANRCAPIQVNYLGYPGTMGTAYIDYIVADKTLISDEGRGFYTEKIVYLPHCYQVNDSARKISERIYTKNELGLPDDAFVFCSFNNNYKILPNIFDSWMRILNATEGSVLWLFEDNPIAAQNLIKEAQARGIDPQRLMFAKRMEHAEHLARHRLADLFLDTLPYNAHTTASDALWAGLPVLTLAGKSFPSRVAASLLNTIGLPDLITTTQEEYERKAIELAHDPIRLMEMKQRLNTSRLSSPLFNGKLFARHLESAYENMYDRYQADLPPDHIYVEK